MRYLTRFIILSFGFGALTWGLVSWAEQEFNFNGLLPGGDQPFSLHPLHLLVLGLAMVPPTLWEIFVMEARWQQNADDQSRPD